MAKATANCVCSVCGAEFVKTKKCYNRREADSWERWAESNYTLCSKCWGEEQRRKEAEKPLTLEVRLDPYSGKIVLAWSGNTKPAKDEIRALGYRWAEVPISGFFGPLDIGQRRLGWFKTLDNLDDLKEELLATRNLNPNIKNEITEIDAVAFRKFQSEQEAKRAKAREKEAELQARLDALDKPAKPEIITNIGYWNGKVYGKNGYYNMYIDNKKVDLTNEEAEQIKGYLEALREYEKVVAEIKNS